MKRLAREDPVAFMEQCILRCRREVRGYSMFLQKQEFSDGRLHPVEVVEVHFRKEPHSVYMGWTQGARLVERSLYVEGENDGMILARPNGKLARLAAGNIVARSPDSPEARKSGRYSLKDYGFQKSTERTLAVWKAAREKGNLKIDYLGVQKFKETGDRPCFVFRQTVNPPERDGIAERTIGFDTENWLQTVSVLRGAGGKLIGAYYFRDIRLNPEFKEGQFERAALVP